MTCFNSRRCLPWIVVSIVLLADQITFAGTIGGFGGAYFLGTGLDYEGNARADLGYKYVELNLGVSGYQSAEIDSYYSVAGSVAIANFKSSVAVRVDRGAIGLVVSSEAINGGFPGSPSTSTYGAVHWSDSASLVWIGNGIPVTIPGALHFNAFFEGTITVDPGMIENGASIGLGLYANGFRISKFFTNSFEIQSSPGFFVSASPNVDGKYDFSYGVGWGSGATSGFAKGDAGHTLKLTSVTFDDGTTPESLGYALVFESGMQSPNRLLPQAVPEPSSLLVVGTGGLGLMALGRRRKVNSGASKQGR